MKTRFVLIPSLVALLTSPLGWAITVPVPNFSFELNPSGEVLGNAGPQDGALLGWTKANGGSLWTVHAGNTPATEGVRLGWLGNYMDAQILNGASNLHFTSAQSLVEISAGDTITFTIDLGKRWDGTNQLAQSPNYALHILIGGTNIATNSAATLFLETATQIAGTASSIAEFSLQHTASSGGPLYLAIVGHTSNSPGYSTSLQQGLLDNVRLEVTPIPEPMAAAGLLALGCVLVLLGKRRR